MLLAGNAIQKKRRNLARADYRKKARQIDQVRLNPQEDDARGHGKSVLDAVENAENMEDYLRGIASHGYVFKPIILYLLDYLIGSRRELSMEMLYLPYVQMDTVSLRTFIRHALMGICVHGGIHLKYEMDNNLLSLITNWDDRDLHAAFNTTGVNEVIREDGDICTVFSPDRVPSGACANYFNGLFSSYLDEYMDLVFQRDMFKIKIQNLSMNIVTAEPNPSFINDIMKIKAITGDDDWKKFLEERMFADVNKSARGMSSEASIRAVTNGGAGNDRNPVYAKQFLKELDMLYDFATSGFEVNRKVPMMKFDEKKGLRKKKVTNTNVMHVPIGMHTKQHIPNIIGEHLFENLVRQTIEKIVRALHLDSNPADLILSLREEIEDMLNLIFAAFITPESFRSLIYDDIPKQIEALRKFYFGVYSRTSERDMLLTIKSEQFKTTYSTDYSLLQAYFSFNFAAAIRERSMESEFRRIEVEYDKMTDMYEESVLAFETDGFGGDLLQLKKPTISLKWGKMKTVVPFVLSKAAAQASADERKVERAEAAESKTAMLADKAEHQGEKDSD